MIDYTRIRQKLMPEAEIGGTPDLILRTATVSAISSAGAVSLLLSDTAVDNVPVLGGVSLVVGSVVQVLSYRGGLLVLGPSKAVTGQAAEAIGSTTNGAYGSSTFGNTLTTTGIHGVAFVAPPSGRVLVHGRAVAGHPTLGQFSLLDYEVREGDVVGSGTVFRAANNSTAGVHQSAVATYQGVVVTGGLVAGLVPGNAYNVCLTYASTGAGGSVFNRRYIVSTPQ